jgi:hypothetical protein
VGGRHPLIPTIIHQLWIDPSGGESGGIAPDVERQSLKWRSRFPTYLYRLWSLEEVLALADLDPALGDRARAAIGSLRFPAAQADVARLILLRRFGGFWVDLKLSPCSAFLPALLDFDLVLTEHFPQPHRPQPNGLLINSFIGSERNTQFIERVLQRVLLNVENRIDGSVFTLPGQQTCRRQKRKWPASRELWGNTPCSLMPRPGIKCSRWRIYPTTTMGCIGRSAKNASPYIATARSSLSAMKKGNGGRYWTRTSDPCDVNTVLYQLS